MRHLILILMIALLPLRSWIGDAMATEMVGAAVQHQLLVAAKPVAAAMNRKAANTTPDADIASPQPLASADADCAGHLERTDAAGANTQCDACSACQACHGMALPSLAVALGADHAHRDVPSIAFMQFASAEAALDKKIPIV